MLPEALLSNCSVTCGLPVNPDLCCEDGVSTLRFDTVRHCCDL